MAKSIIGVVTSDKSNKTIVVTVQTRKTHPLYKKQYTVNSKFMAHDEKNEAKVGDKVVITEVRPISARKRFILTEISEKAAIGFNEADATADVSEEAVAPKAEKPAPRPKAVAKTTEKTEEASE